MNGQANVELKPQQDALVCSQDELFEYAREIGIDPKEEPELLWLAKEGINAPPPPGWKSCVDDNGEAYYFNSKTGESIWDDPSDEVYRKKVEDERNRLRHQRAGGQTSAITNGIESSSSNGIRKGADGGVLNQNGDSSLRSPDTDTTTKHVALVHQPNGTSLVNNVSNHLQMNNGKSFNTQTPTGQVSLLYDGQDAQPSGPSLIAAPNHVHEHPSTKRGERVVQLIDVNAEYERLQRQYKEQLRELDDRLDSDTRQERAQILRQFEADQEALRGELNVRCESEVARVKLECEDKIRVLREEIERERDVALIQLENDRNQFLSQCRLESSEAKRHELQRLEQEKRAASERIAQDSASFEERELQRLQQIADSRLQEARARCEERLASELREFEQRLATQRNEQRRSIELEHTHELRRLDEQLELAQRIEAERREQELRTSGERDRVIADLEASLGTVSKQRKMQLTSELQREMEIFCQEHESRLRQVTEQFTERERSERASRMERLESERALAEKEQSLLKESLRRDTESEKERLQSELNLLGQTVRGRQDAVLRSSQSISEKESELERRERTAKELFEQLSSTNESLEKQVTEKLQRSMQSGLRELQQIEAERSLFARENELNATVRRDADQLRTEVDTLRSTKERFVQQARALRDQVRVLREQQSLDLSMNTQMNESVNVAASPSPTSSIYARFVEQLRTQPGKQTALENVSLASTDGTQPDLADDSRSGRSSSLASAKSTGQQRKTVRIRSPKQSPRTTAEQPTVPVDNGSSPSHKTDDTVIPSETEVPSHSGNVVRSNSSAMRSNRSPRPSVPLSAQRSVPEDPLKDALEFLLNQSDAVRNYELFSKAIDLSNVSTSRRSSTSQKVRHHSHSSSVLSDLYAPLSQLDSAVTMLASSSSQAPSKIRSGGGTPRKFQSSRDKLELDYHEKSSSSVESIPKEPKQIEAHLVELNSSIRQLVDVLSNGSSTTSTQNGLSSRLPSSASASLMTLRTLSNMHSIRSPRLTTPRRSSDWPHTRTGSASLLTTASAYESRLHSFLDSTLSESPAHRHSPTPMTESYSSRRLEHQIEEQRNWLQRFTAGGSALEGGRNNEREFDNKVPSSANSPSEAETA